MRRFYSLENKLHKNKNLYDEYSKFIHEYINLGHAKYINFNFKSFSPSDEGYFLPHHAVLKDSSPTTKLRVVFDASAKTSNQKSLNDILAMGKLSQPELFEIIFKFRLYKYVFTADISKMYRQILVADEDQKYQRIIWRDSPSEKLKCIQLNTVTYGMAPSPYLATRTLAQLAFDEQKQFPRASQAVLNEFYIDDCLVGKNSLQEIQDLKRLGMLIIHL